MKKRLFLMAAMVLVALAAAAQVGRTAQGQRQAVNLDGVSTLDAMKMQPDTVMPNGEWQRVVQSEMSAKEGFKYAKQVMARIVPDYQRNVQLEDTADCKLVVTATLPLLTEVKSERTTFLMRGTYDVTLTVVVKDQRYRVSCEAVRCSFTVKSGGFEVDRKQDRPMADVSGMTEGGMQRNLQWTAGRLVWLIDSRLKKQKSDDDF